MEHEAAHWTPPKRTISYILRIERRTVLERTCRRVVPSQMGCAARHFYYKYLRGAL
jgi:hypothetical protein